MNEQNGFLLGPIEFNNGVLYVKTGYGFMATRYQSRFESVWFVDEVGGKDIPYPLSEKVIDHLKEEAKAQYALQERLEKEAREKEEDDDYWAREERDYGHNYPEDGDEEDDEEDD